MEGHGFGVRMLDETKKQVVALLCRCAVKEMMLQALSTKDKAYKGRAVEEKRSRVSQDHAHIIRSMFSRRTKQPRSLLATDQINLYLCFRCSPGYA